MAVSRMSRWSSSHQQATKHVHGASPHARGSFPKRLLSAVTGRSDMLARNSLLMGLVLFGCVAFARTKQEKPPQILLSARYVYVEALLDDGRSAGPNVSPEDRQAVANVTHAIEKWGQYKIAARRSEADLVIAVRKGRVASAYDGGHVGIHTSPTGGPLTTEAGPISGG